LAAWKSAAHLEDHDGDHRREFPGYTLEQYDASAQETITIGVRFTFRDRRTGLARVGYYHRATARFTIVDADGFIVSHFRTDEAHVAELDRSTYSDEE